MLFAGLPTSSVPSLCGQSWSLKLGQAAAVDPGEEAVPETDGAGAVGGPLAEAVTKKSGHPAAERTRLQRDFSGLRRRRGQLVHASFSEKWHFDAQELGKFEI